MDINLKRIVALDASFDHSNLSGNCSWQTFLISKNAADFQSKQQKSSSSIAVLGIG
jgi:hypothetical protein